MRRIDRRLALALWLALCFHGPLVLAGFYRVSYDGATHEFFADHYARSWFGLWEPRWFGGFSVSSYPPLVHQLLALLGSALDPDLAFGALLLLTLLLLPVAIWNFARLFVSPAAAGAAAIVAVFVPALTLTADAFGQLPTLVSLALALGLAAEWTRYVERGGAVRLALVGALAGLTFAAHHATPLLFLPPAFAACLIALGRADHRVRLGRAAAGAAVCAIAGALSVLPLWIWALAVPHQAFISHLSRADFLRDLDAQELFFWAMYGTLPALAIFGLIVGWDRRTGPLAVLALGFGVLGLGGTTPLPSLIFGPAWQWLTYDRFALWSAVALVPLAGVAVDRLLRARHLAATVAVGVAFVGLAFFASVDAASAFLSMPAPPDVRPAAEFLNGADHDQWRYQTFGFGDAAARLALLTRAGTMDGAYFTARAVPELSDSGIGTLDSALWADPSGAALRRALGAADRYSIRWVFVAEPRYGSFLPAAGFHFVTWLSDGIGLWEKPDVPSLPVGALRFGEPDVLGILWGSLPLVLCVAALVLAFVQHRPLRFWQGRSIWPWTPSRLAPVSSAFRHRG